jgi:hypothetical protein
MTPYRRVRSRRPAVRITVSGLASAQFVSLSLASGDELKIPWASSATVRAAGAGMLDVDRAGTSHGYVCDPRLDNEMQQADALQLTNPPRAAVLWTRIDRDRDTRSSGRAASARQPSIGLRHGAGVIVQPPSPS